MWRRRIELAAIGYTVMASYRGHPVDLYLRSGHKIERGVVRHVGAVTVEVLTNDGSATVALVAIDAVRSLVPESASAEFPRPDEDRTGVFPSSDGHSA